MKTRITALVASCMIALVLRADPIGVQALATGVVKYPSQSADSVGNESQVTYSDSAASPGNSSVTASINETISGTDASAGPGNIGTSGTTTVNFTASASLGHLAGSASTFAESHSNGGSSVFFPHGTAAINPTALPNARFDDVTTVYNPDYALGAAIPVELTLFLDWHGGFDLGTAGFNFAQSGATALLAVDWVGSVSAFDLMRSDTPSSNWAYSAPQTLNFVVANGGTFGWWSSLTIFTGSALGGVLPDTPGYGAVTTSSFSNATIDITPTSGYAHTTFTSTTGLAYGGGPVGVPDATPTLVLLGLGLGGLGLAARSRWAIS